MTPSVDEVVRESLKALAKVRRETRGNPQKAAEFLIRAGIAERCKPSKSAPRGVRLVKQLRD